MKKIIITTPENIDIEYTLADLGSRAAAALIDTIIQIAALILVFIVMLIVCYLNNAIWDKQYGLIIGVCIISYAVISYGYYIILELTMNGRTVGKRVMKIRTIRNNGQPITLRHSAVRNLFRIFLDLYGIGVILIFVSKTHKRIGDFAASTIVIIEKSKEAPITLDKLERINDKFDYYITAQEQKLLQDYFARKSSFENVDELRSELKKHFTDKFEMLGNISEWESFINEL